MKKFLFVVLLLLVSVFSSALAPSNVVGNVHKATFEIGQEVLLGEAGCSATAIGPHAILTASHCEMPSDELYIRGDEKPSNILGRLRDGQDHTIYLVDRKFDSYVEVDEKDALAQGEDVFILGNPGKWSDIYRRGYVAGATNAGSMFNPLPDIILFDFPNFHGDSGAGIFNDQGKLVDVVSIHLIQSGNEAGDTIRMTGAFKLAFDQKALDSAKNFEPSKKA